LKVYADRLRREGVAASLHRIPYEWVLERRYDRLSSI
jgi:hypothetical protein